MSSDTIPNGTKIITRERAAESRDAGTRTETRETREASPRAAEVSDYRPPSQLPDPDPIPGYVYRWVRKTTRGQMDEINFGQRRSEGWEPVSPEEQPGLVQKMYGTPGSGLIEIGGLVLCKAPRERIEARARYFTEKARAAQEAVDRQMMKEQDPRMPILKPERTSRVSRSF